MHFQSIPTSFIKLGSFLVLLLTQVQIISAQESSASTLVDRADVLLKSGSIEEGTSLYNKVLSHTEPNDLSDTLKLRAHIGIARAWHMQQQLDSSLHTYLKALELAKSVNQEAFLADIYMGVGVIQAQVKNFPEAIRFLEQADKLEASPSTKNLQIAVNLANVLMDADRHTEALPHLQESLEMAKRIEQEGIQAIIHTNLSNLFIKNSNWREAISHSEQSLQIRNRLQQPSSVITYNNLGYALMQSGQLNEAKVSFLQALSPAQGSQRQQVLKNLKALALLQNDYQAAVQYFEEYDQLKDSIQEQEVEQRIAEITNTYQNAEKSLQIQTLERENLNKRRQLTTVSIGSTLFILLICFAAYLYLKNVHVKRELSHSRTRNQLLRAQLNPHFVFNSLQHVQHYLYTNEKETSMAYLSNFARLMRSTLMHSDTDWISLEDEIELLRHYLNLQQLASQNPFDFELNVDPKIDISFIQIPPMLLQPFLENAVRHGIVDQSNPQIKVEFRLVDQKLMIMITDNGLGISTTSLDRSNNLHKSMGSKLVSKRINEINKQHPHFITITIDKAHLNEHNPGTRVQFIFDLSKK